MPCHTYTSPNCQRNKIFCCNFWTRRDTNMKLWIFWLYTFIFMSVYAIVMVDRDSGYKTLQNNVNGMEWPSKSPDVADRAGMGPAWQTCAPTSCPATDVASNSACVSARMEQHSNEHDSVVVTLNEKTLSRCDSICRWGRGWGGNFF